MSNPPRSHDPTLQRPAPRRWSAFVDEWCRRYPARLSALQSAGYFDADQPALTGPPPDPDAAADFAADLRRYRCENLALIAWRDLAGRDALAATLDALSALAERCVDAALGEAEACVARRHGCIVDADGVGQRLAVIGMGKLGGGELNFSSDIDLVFVYRRGGESDGDRPLEAADYYRRVAQRLVQTLHETTADGFVYRVDTRLRPFGDAGALVASLSAMENYYQAHGREWERYAWIKARPVAGDLATGQRLLVLLQPFVYRRYLDYGTFESIREMKALIARQVEQGNLHHNIKLGRGGIREIEFMVQAFQLIRGGQEPDLRDHRLLPTLSALVRLGHLAPEHGPVLEAAYRFLRRVENRLQMAADRQTHDLPSEAPERAALAAATGYADWSAFAHDLAATREGVRAAFDELFAAPSDQADEAEDPRAPRLLALWEASLDAEAARAVVVDYGLRDADAALAALTGLRDRGAYRELGDRGRRWMTQLLPLLFAAAAARDDVDRALTRALAVVAAILGRSNYIALLVENPGALATLVRLCEASDWFTARVADQPALLDTLLDPRQLYAPPARPELEAALSAELDAAGRDDLDAQMNTLRRFTQTGKLRIAAADVTDSMPLMIVSDRLSELAEAVLGAALSIAWRQLSARHGVPRTETAAPAAFGVVAYGKLGGLELGYSSDLDLVFIYDGPSDAATDGERALTLQVFFTRLAQRLINVLATQTPAGRAYEVDMRLRPSGRSGLMVSHIAAFEGYQRERAWTWEHQALVRARFVAGSSALGERFDSLRREVLARAREPGALADDVRAMRERMRANKDRSGAEWLDVKQMPGGLVDIEFMAQFAALRYGHDCPELLIYSDAMRILETLESAGLVDYASTTALTRAYRDYRRRIHADSLQNDHPMIAADALTRQRAAVRDLWQRWFE